MIRTFFYLYCAQLIFTLPLGRNPCNTISFDHLTVSLKMLVNQLPKIEGLYRVPMMDSKESLFYRYDPTSSDPLSPKMAPDARYFIIIADRKTRKIKECCYGFHFEEANWIEIAKKIQDLSAYYPVLKKFDSKWIETGVPIRWKEDCKNYSTSFEVSGDGYTLMVFVGESL